MIRYRPPQMLVGVGKEQGDSTVPAVQATAHFNIHEQRALFTSKCSVLSPSAVPISTYKQVVQGLLPWNIASCVV